MFWLVPVAPEWPDPGRQVAQWQPLELGLLFRPLAQTEALIIRKIIDSTATLSRALWPVAVAAATQQAQLAHAKPLCHYYSCTWPPFAHPGRGLYPFQRLNNGARQLHFLSHVGGAERTNAPGLGAGPSQFRARCGRVAQQLSEGTCPPVRSLLCPALAKAPVLGARVAGQRR